MRKKDKICIAVMVKDEQPYLGEWLRWHLRLVDEVFVAEDYGSSSHAAVTRPFGRRVHLFGVGDAISHCARAQTRQYLYNEFMCHYLKMRGDTAWCAFIDVDEFIHVGSAESLREALGLFKAAKGLKLAWRMFNANGRVAAPPAGMPTPEAYPVPSPIVPSDWTGKTVVNIRALSWDDDYRNIHDQFGGVYVSGKAVVKPWDYDGRAPENFRLVWLDHYFTKSLEDWMRRMRRGNMQNGYRTMEMFWRMNPGMEALAKKE